MDRGKNICWAFTVVAIAGMGFSFSVGAHSGATGIVKERMELMMSAGKSMKALGAMFKGKAAYEPQLIARHAAHIGENSDRIIPLFPQGSLGKHTQALPAIWSDWSQFETMTADMREQSKLLSQVAATGDKRDTRKQFAKLARTCTACHTKFRIKK